MIKLHIILAVVALICESLDKAGEYLSHLLALGIKRASIADCKGMYAHHDIPFSV